MKRNTNTYKFLSKLTDYYGRDCYQMQLLLNLYENPANVVKHNFKKIEDKKVGELENYAKKY